MASLADHSGQSEKDHALPEFKVPLIYKNQEGWGPTTLPAKFLDVPYSPFGKGDRLGRAADFTSRWARERYGVNNEDSEFNLVDTAEKKRPQLRVKRWRPLSSAERRKQQERRGIQGVQKRGDKNPNRRKQKAQSKRGKLQSRRWQSNNRYRHGRYNQQPTLEASVKVQSDWRVIEQFPQAQLSKLQGSAPEAEDLHWFGHLEYYDDTFDRVSTKQKKNLERVANREHFYVTTTDDPVVESLAEQGAGNVFATDKIMALLMASPRAHFSWDIVCERVGNALFLDKREESE